MDKALYKELLQSADDAIQVARRMSFASERFWAIPDKWFDHLVNAVKASKLDENPR